MSSSRLLLTAMALSSLLTLAQDAATPPRFDDFPATELYNGSPVAPILDAAELRLFRSRIREGVAKGIGVERDGKEQPGPNFAGHYIVITWGCGSPCIMMAIVDAKNGRVHRSPMTSSLQMSWLEGGPWLPAVQFRRDSRLMILEPEPSLAKNKVYIHYFVWHDDSWTLVRKIPCGPKRSATACGSQKY